MSFFFNDTATTEIYTLSLHDALPIYELLASVAREQILFPQAVADEGCESLQHVVAAQVTVGVVDALEVVQVEHEQRKDRKSTRLNSSHANISYAVFCLNKKTYISPNF